MTSLRAKMKQEMTLRGLSSATQEKYLNSIIKLNDFYQCNPAKLNENDIKAFLMSPKNQALAASTYNIMIHGLRFFYEVVLGKPYLAMLLPRKREAQKL